MRCLARRLVGTSPSDLSSCGRQFKLNAGPRKERQEEEQESQHCTTKTEACLFLLSCLKGLLFEPNQDGLYTTSKSVRHEPLAVASNQPPTAAFQEAPPAHQSSEHGSSFLPCLPGGSRPPPPPQAPVDVSLACPDGMPRIDAAQTLADGNSHGSLRSRCHPHASTRKAIGPAAAVTLPDTLPTPESYCKQHTLVLFVIHFLDPTDWMKAFTAQKQHTSSSSGSTMLDIPAAHMAASCFIDNQKANGHSLHKVPRSSPSQDARDTLPAGFHQLSVRQRCSGSSLAATSFRSPRHAPRPWDRYLLKPRGTLDSPRAHRVLFSRSQVPGRKPPVCGIAGDVRKTSSSPSSVFLLAAPSLFSGTRPQGQKRPHPHKRSTRFRKGTPKSLLHDF
ncbi:uncharacterized protein CLUP02_00367 [Colletotrichum lupini]|uniref:Uncharacterized protein n=1 Tax=Colletotrichum lupini TaxID=145971 RepID=A0A9Q8SB95_9PEZI|nr:uncharacterized protein CLUP02_00367 [Colletotrichum lupini]UQC73721.1 hypothetical protein CLUP02_00367 [Colletotrichum lupini]